MAMFPLRMTRLTLVTGTTVGHATRRFLFVRRLELRKWSLSRHWKSVRLYAEPKLFTSMHRPLQRRSRVSELRSWPYRFRPWGCGENGRMELKCIPSLLKLTAVVEMSSDLMGTRPRPVPLTGVVSHSMPILLPLRYARRVVMEHGRQPVTLVLPSWPSRLYDILRSVSILIRLPPMTLMT